MEQIQRELDIIKARLDKQKEYAIAVGMMVVALIYFYLLLS